MAHRAVNAGARPHWRRGREVRSARVLELPEQALQVPHGSARLPDGRLGVAELLLHHGQRPLPFPELGPYRAQPGLRAVALGLPTRAVGLTARRLGLLGGTSIRLGGLEALSLRDGARACRRDFVRPAAGCPGAALARPSTRPDP